MVLGIRYAVPPPGCSNHGTAMPVSASTGRRSRYTLYGRLIHDGTSDRSANGVPAA